MFPNDILQYKLLVPMLINHIYIQNICKTGAQTTTRQSSFGPCLCSLAVVVVVGRAPFGPVEVVVDASVCVMVVAVGSRWCLVGHGSCCGVGGLSSSCGASGM